MEKEQSYKDKALAHVRQTCPELMEDVNLVRITGKHKFDEEEVVLFEDGKFTDKLGSYELVTVTEDGKPATPQLNHWLRGINESQVIPMPRMSVDGVLSRNDWAMIFNPETGQPATEADYKAYCTIVGV